MTYCIICRTVFCAYLPYETSLNSVRHIFRVGQNRISIIIGIIRYGMYAV